MSNQRNQPNEQIPPTPADLEAAYTAMRQRVRAGEPIEDFDQVRALALSLKTDVVGDLGSINDGDVQAWVPAHMSAQEVADLLLAASKALLELNSTTQAFMETRDWAERFERTRELTAPDPAESRSMIDLLEGTGDEKILLDRREVLRHVAWFDETRNMVLTKNYTDSQMWRDDDFDKYGIGPTLVAGALDRIVDAHERDELASPVTIDDVLWAQDARRRLSRLYEATNPDESEFLPPCLRAAEPSGHGGEECER